MRVSMSATGSDILISYPPYQLALVTPGTSPRNVSSRSLLRHRPNLRNTPRGRPVSVQRFRWRTGLALRGSCCSFSRAVMRSSSDRLVSLIWASNAARLAANLAASLRRFSSRLIRASFAMSASILERELESREQRLGFLVGFRGRRDADVHPAQRVDLVVLDLREDDLLFDAHVVVAAAVETLARHATEVPHTGNGDRDQTVEKLVHARTTQRDHAADRVAVADL